MALPNFLCVATVKGGTTTLHDLLKQHDDIFLPSKIKEVRYFDVDENFARGLEWYKGFFSDHAGEKAIGEVAPTYAYNDDVPSRIRDQLGPDVKLIFSFRNPVDRAYSHYVMNCMKGYESTTFARAIAQERQRARGTYPQRLRFGYLDQGNYSVQISRFLEFFPKENMLFLTLEDDLAHKKDKALARVYSFLGIGPCKVDTEIWSYAGRPTSVPAFPFLRGLANWKPLRRLARTGPARNLKKLLQRDVPKRLDDETRRRLMEEHYRDEIERLEGLIGRELGSWRA